MKPIISYAVQIIISKFSEDGTVHIAVMPYTKPYGSSKAHTTLRLPTETGKPAETVRRTALRGATEEAARDKTKFEASIWGMAHAVLGPDQNDPEGLHAKVAMFMSYERGDLRCFGKVDDDDTDEFHGPMEWMEVSDLLKPKLADQPRPKLLHSHAVSITAFLQVMANQPGFEKIVEKYFPILNIFPVKPLSPEEYNAVKALTDKQ